MNFSNNQTQQQHNPFKFVFKQSEAKNQSKQQFTQKQQQQLPNPFQLKSESNKNDENWNPNSHQPLNSYKPNMSTMSSANSCQSKYQDFFSQQFKPSLDDVQDDAIRSKNLKTYGQNVEMEDLSNCDGEFLQLRENDAADKQKLGIQNFFNASKSQSVMTNSLNQNGLQTQNGHADRFIPVRNNQDQDTHLQDLLMDISADSSHIKNKFDGSSTSPIDQKTLQSQETTHFKALLANQLVQNKSKNQKVHNYHHSLSQSNLLSDANQDILMQLQKQSILPKKLLTFKKSQTKMSCDMQDEDGRLISDDHNFQSQLLVTKRAFSYQATQGLNSNQNQSMLQQDAQNQKFKPRKRAFPLPSSPMKIFAAPDIVSDLNLNLIDWAPQSNPYAENSKFALCLYDDIYLVDLKGSKHKVMLSLKKQNQTDGDEDHYISSVNFDRSGEAIAVGTSHHLIQIYDVERGMQVRNIYAHGARVSSISWNRSVLAPYLITSGGQDAIIMNHDIRAKNSIINYMTNHRGEICSLSWSVNQSHELMQTSDPSNVYTQHLAATKIIRQVYGDQVTQLMHQLKNHHGYSRPIYSKGLLKHWLGHLIMKVFWQLEEVW
eukprot:403373527